MVVVFGQKKSRLCPRRLHDAVDDMRSSIGERERESSVGRFFIMWLKVSLQSLLVFCVQSPNNFFSSSSKKGGRKDPFE